MTTPGPLLASDVIALQRTVGNQAVQRILAAGGPTRPDGSGASGGAAILQRWPTNTPNLNFDNTKRIIPIMSGQPVLFFHDSTDPPVVVKGEDAPYGLTLLQSFMHKQVHGTPTVVTKDGTPVKNKLVDLIKNPATTPNDKWTDLGNAQGTAFPIVADHWEGNTPAEKARTFMSEQFKSLPKVQIMKVAQGQNARKLAEEDATTPSGQVSRIRELFSDAAYLNKLGQLTAADHFLENVDRATQNFGNWMTDANGAITLIDNMDGTARGLWQAGDKLGPVDNLEKLANLPSVAKSVVGGLKFEVGMMGGGAARTQIELWLQEAAPGGTREKFIEKNLTDGLTAGCARIVKLYGGGILSKKTRDAKKAATKAYKMDKKAGDAGDIKYWTRLRARAKRLKSLV